MFGIIYWLQLIMPILENMLHGSDSICILTFSNRDRPGLGLLGLGLEILISAQAQQAQLFEKGLENWSFYEAKSRGHQGLGLVRAQLSKLRLDLLGLDPSLT